MKVAAALTSSTSAAKTPTSAPSPRLSASRTRALACRQPPPAPSRPPLSVDASRGSLAPRKWSNSASIAPPPLRPPLAAAAASSSWSSSSSSSYYNPDDYASAFDDDGTQFGGAGNGIPSEDAPSSSSDDPPWWRRALSAASEAASSPAAAAAAQVGQTAASLLFVVLYVWSTYSSPPPGGFRQLLDAGLCFVFAADYVIRLAVSLFFVFFCSIIFQFLFLSPLISPPPPTPTLSLSCSPLSLSPARRVESQNDLLVLEHPRRPRRVPPAGRALPGRRRGRRRRGRCRSGGGVLPLLPRPRLPGLAPRLQLRLPLVQGPPRPASDARRAARGRARPDARFFFGKAARVGGLGAALPARRVCRDPALHDLGRRQPRRAHPVPRRPLLRDDDADDGRLRRRRRQVDGRQVRGAGHDPARRHHHPGPVLGPVGPAAGAEGDAGAAPRGVEEAAARAGLGEAVRRAGVLRFPDGVFRGRGEGGRGRGAGRRERRRRRQRRRRAPLVRSRLLPPPRGPAPAQRAHGGPRRQARLRVPRAPGAQRAQADAGRGVGAVRARPRARPGGGRGRGAAARGPVLPEPGAGGPERAVPGVGGQVVHAVRRCGLSVLLLFLGLFGPSFGPSPPSSRRSPPPPLSLAASLPRCLSLCLSLSLPLSLCLSLSLPLSLSASLSLAASPSASLSASPSLFRNQSFAALRASTSRSSSAARSRR